MKKLRKVLKEDKSIIILIIVITFLAILFFVLDYLFPSLTEMPWLNSAGWAMTFVDVIVFFGYVLREND